MLELTVAFFVFGALGAVMLGLNRWLGPRRSNPVKETPFECGSPILRDRVSRVPVPFAAAALAFLLFDVEAAFFFPLAAAFRRLGPAGFAALAGYVLLLVPAFVYAWKKGLFRWGA